MTALQPSFICQHGLPVGGGHDYDQKTALLVVVPQK